MTKACKSDNNHVFLCIPNNEIREIFKDMIVSHFKSFILAYNREEFFTAFWIGDQKNLENIITDILVHSISFFDTHAEFCHGFIAGLFVGPGYIIQSNKECGDGRPDIIIADERNSRVAILEIKSTNNPTTFLSLSSKALEQINKNNYNEPFIRDGNVKIYNWGLAFYKKMCRASFAFCNINHRIQKT
ncbi:MAG: PD-(D/E)XK nuclease domain-containing protein [Desulfovibrionaceae bacterium]|nr:PD-(D/E)XK nuclease domain-containing protein [Desulfovibrionaceae bacterium]